jgi:hypothetical protein
VSIDGVTNIETVLVHRDPRSPMRRMAITTLNPAENVKEKLRKHFL